MMKQEKSNNNNIGKGECYNISALSQPYIPHPLQISNLTLLHKITKNFISTTIYTLFEYLQNHESYFTIT